MSSTTNTSRSSLPLTIRPATRADLPSIARLHAAAFDNFEIYNWILPHRHAYPEQFYRYLLLRNKLLFAEPHVLYYIAEAPRRAVEAAIAAREGRPGNPHTESDGTARDDSRQNEMVPLGFACWEALGSSALAQRWSRENNTWSASLERLLLPLERTYVQYFLNRVADYNSFTSLRAKFGDSWTDVPGGEILHLQFLITGPEYQGFGVGGKLLKWGFEVARREGLPMGLESSYAGAEFYRRKGFKVLKELVIEDWTEQGRPTTRTPLMAWEGREREGRWLEDDGEGRWRWKRQGKVVEGEAREALEPSDVSLGET